MSERLVLGERVPQVAEVDEVDELLRGQLGQQLPQRLARAGARDRSQSALTTAAAAMWMTPFSGPSQRSWLSPVSSRRERRRGRRGRSSTGSPTTSGASAWMPATCDVVAAPDGEGQPVPLLAAAGPHDHVGGRVVGVGVHRVRAVELARGGEPDVVRPRSRVISSVTADPLSVDASPRSACSGWFRKVQTMLTTVWTWDVFVVLSAQCV